MGLANQAPQPYKGPMKAASHHTLLNLKTNLDLYG